MGTSELETLYGDMSPLVGIIPLNNNGMQSYYDRQMGR